MRRVALKSSGRMLHGVPIDNLFYSFVLFRDFVVQLNFSDQPPFKTMPDPEASPEIRAVLNRPATERLREYKYRFAQSTVFGLPVIALHYFGPSLGGPEAGRWAGMLQMLLAGWVIYVGAMGMLVEGILLRKTTADALIALLAIGLYLASAIGVVSLFATAKPSAIPGMFHAAVILIMVWTAVQWWCQRARLPFTSG